MAGPSGSPSTHEAWVRGLLPLAQQWEAKTGIPASTWLAMAASESNWGAAGNSLFGIKGSGSAGSLNSPTWESVNGQRQDTNANFAAYNNANEAFQDFWDLVSTSPRYAEAVKHLPNDPQGFLRGINTAGYATDQDWASKIQNIASTTIEPMIGTNATSGSRTMGVMRDSTPPSAGGGLTQEELTSILGETPTPEQVALVGDNSSNLSPDTAPSAYGNQGGNAPAINPGDIAPGGYSGQTWQAIVQQHGGIAGISPSKSKYVKITDKLAPNYGQTVSQPDSNYPSYVAFNDGTIVMAILSGGTPEAPNAVQVVPFGKQAAAVSKLETFPDGSLRQEDPSKPLGSPQRWITIAPPPDLTDKKTPKTLTLTDGRVLQYNWDTHNWDTLTQSQKIGNPDLHFWPDGSLHQYDPTTGDWPQIAPPDRSTQDEQALRIAQAQKNLLPAQQKLFQDAYDSVDMIKQKMITGQVSYKEGNDLIGEIHSGLQASLEGTTLFDKFKQKQDQQRAQATEAGAMLRNRVTEGTNLAHSLLSTAAGHVLMPMGKTTLGIDPYAIARSEVNELGGGADLFSKASENLKSFFSGAGSNAPAPADGIVSAGSPPPASSPAPASNGTSQSLQELLTNILAANGGNGAAAGYPTESGLFRQQELTPRGPAILNALMPTLMAGS